MWLVSVVCFQVDISATRRFINLRGPTEYGVSECDRENSEKGGLSSLLTPIQEQKSLLQLLLFVCLYARHVRIY
jgi:hypothetical protein